MQIKLKFLLVTIGYPAVKSTENNTNPGTETLSNSNMLCFFSIENCQGIYMNVLR